MKKITKMSLAFASFAPFIGVVSCSSQPKGWDSEIQIQVKSGYDPVVTTDMAKKLSEEINRLKKQNSELDKYPEVNVTFNVDGEDNKIVQDVASGKKDFGIASISAINLANHSHYLPVLQTQTNNFTFDSQWSSYDNGMANDPLRKIAKATNEQFLNEYPYASIPETAFNGSIYPDYYDSSKQVDFYRGAIYMAGDQNTIDNITSAWENKDWNTFRDFGFITGDSDSGGSWLLEEQLLKKHFTKDGQEPFGTLDEDKANNEEKYTNGNARDLLHGATNNFHIAFDDEGAFAYTKRKEDWYFYYGKMQVLTTTNPLKYDVGIARSSLDPKEANLIAKAFVNLSASKNDLYGPTSGYNSYAVIEENEIQSEIYDKWENILK